MSDLAATLRLAAALPFYRRHWRDVPGDPGQAPLSALPILGAERWQRAVRDDPAAVLAAAPILWTLVSCARNVFWTPVGAGEFEAATTASERALRRAGVTDGQRVVTILPGAPSPWNVLTYLASQSRLQVDLFPLSLQALRLRNGLTEFPAAERIDCVLGRRHDVETVSAGMPGLSDPAAVIACASDEALVPDGDLLMLPGGISPLARCRAAAWHLPSESWVAEIANATVASRDPALVHPLQSAPAGFEGSLLITTLSSTAPMIRIDTGLHVRAPAVPRCPCGDADPWFVVPRDTSLARGGG